VAKTRTTWAKGTSGNPGGRRPGTGVAERLRASIAKDVPAIIAALVGRAKDGDPAAAKLLLDRVCPPLRPTDAPVRLRLAGTLDAQGGAVLAALSTGRLTPAQAGDLLGALTSQAKLAEWTDLEVRIRTLEQQVDVHGRR